jgi:hypothetical protein
MTDIDELERLAKEATRGDWKVERHLDWVYPQTEVRATEIDRPVARFVDGEPTFCCTIGKAEREWANADFIAAANPVAVLEIVAEVHRLREDAERYRWLRGQYWDASNLFVVAGSKSQVRLGTDCPNHDRLDAAIDAARAKDRA